MMAHDSDADAAGDFPEKEMVGETFQVDAPPVSRLEVETLWVRAGLVDERVQLLPELVTQPLVDTIVMAQNPGDIE
jgi:hypothetical protein